jgi:hypothetical protein
MERETGPRTCVISASDWMVDGAEVAVDALIRRRWTNIRGAEHL